MEFSEQGEFIDRPVKTYSSGMHVRLGFSVAAHMGARLLVIDEALAVGDHDFAYRCYNHIGRLLEEGVAATAEDVDLATVFGLGFPPFLGGLCRWVADEGPQVLLDRLIALCEEHGARFEPSRRWRNVAAGKPIYK